MTELPKALLERIEEEAVLNSAGTSLGYYDYYKGATLWARRAWALRSALDKAFYQTAEPGKINHDELILACLQCAVLCQEALAAFDKEIGLEK